MKCRGCEVELTLTFIDLGLSPIANNLISKEKSNFSDDYYPLHAKTCMNCSLVQIPEITNREALFHSDYVYFSSYSTSWLSHSREYASQMISYLKLGKDDLVVEVASNDGYLLQYFAKNQINVLGIEPAEGVAKVALDKGIPTVIEFFGEEVADRLVVKKKAKLMIGNNVLAHVPNIHDFIKGFSILIEDDGIITFEFPHLLNLIQNNQFDTIYHEHYSYLNVIALLPIFEQHGLKIVKVETLETHGGSLRIFVAKSGSVWKIENSVQEIISKELACDPREELIWSSFQKRVLAIKSDILEALVQCRKSGLQVAAYGAAAKGNTLLNFVGIDSNLIDYVVDLNPHKQGKLLPGSRIPIVDEQFLYDNPPDILLILPWNIITEVQNQLIDLSKKGMKFLRAIPSLEYF